MGLKELIEKRNDILFAEIGALIHDLGKLSKEFVEGKDDHIEQDNDNVKKFRHEKVWIDLSLITDCTNNQFLKRLLELILKREPLNRINQLKSKIYSTGKSSFTANDLPNWAKNDSTLKNLGSILKSDLESFVSKLFENTTFLKYHYMKNSFFVLNELVLKNIFKIKIFNNWSVSLLPIQHHRNDKKVWNYDKRNLPDKMKLILAPYGADGIDSAVDKMVADVLQSKQSKEKTYISTAFGYESQKIDLNLVDTDPNSLTNIRKNYADKLAKILENLKNNPSDIKKWIEERSELFRETKKAFLNALGETRRPANDVTLWDHSFSVASLYKAALAEVVINRWKEPKDIKWKLLSVRFDGDEFYYTAPKIADVLGRKALVEKILDNIKVLLEVIIPIGNEIYRDENGSVFLVPESAKDENGVFEINNDIWEEIKDIEFKNVVISFEGKWKNKNLSEIANNPNNLKELIEKISSYMSVGIFIPKIYLSDPSRGALNLGGEISKERKYNIDIEKLKQKWIAKKEGYEKCTVCGLIPVPLSYKEKEELDKKIEKEGWQKLSEDEKNQYKAYERKICIDCLKFSLNRVEDWRRNHFDTSIWLDEIADENNRIALVYLSFDLGRWLNGEMLNTFLSKPIKVLKGSGLSLENYDDIIQHIVENFDNKDENFWKVLEPYSKNKTGEEIFKDIVSNRNENWQETYKINDKDINEDDKETKAKILLLNLTRKHPSFARLRRIWETTRNFGIDIFEKVKNKFDETNFVLGKKNRIILEFDRNDNLKVTHTYWFKNENGEKYELVVIENKNKAAVISVPKNFKLSNKSIALYDENFRNVFTTLQNVKIKNEPSDYYPLIPYQFEPSKTLFFMPLKNVWEVMQLIKQEYEIQFNKVQNRLPINIGFVAFHKRTPMYAVLDAAKRMYSRKIEKKEVKICSAHEICAQKNCRLYGGKIGSKVKEIKLENGYEYHFSYSTGDPGKEDIFHPYFIVENSNEWKTYVDETWKTIKHVKNLHKGDNISFYPSHFDFLWLDTNTRRLDVGEKRIHWLFKENSPKPYNLKDIEKFERLRELLLGQLKLSASQLLNIYGLLISKLEEWQLLKDKLPIEDETFIALVESSILSVPLRLKISSSTGKGKITKDDFKFLKKMILNGIFFDFVDMWHTILKRKFMEEENE